MKPIPALAALLLSLPTLQAATTTYVADFDSAATGTNLPSPFAENGGGTRNSSIENKGAGDNVLRQTVSATSDGSTGVAANTSASIPFSDLGGSNNRDFVITTTFSITANSIVNNATGSTSSTFNVSIGALGSDPNLGSGSRYMLTYTLLSAGGNQPSGSLSITDNGTGAADGFSTVTGSARFTSGTPATQAGTRASGTNAVTLDTLYTMSLKGIYDSGVLTLTGTLTGGGGTDLTVEVADTSPRTGNNFGVRTAINTIGTSGNNAVGALTTEFDSLSVAVPEPSALALAGLGLAALGFRRARNG